MSEWLVEVKDGVPYFNILREIVRCKDCKHNPTKEWFRCPMSYLSADQRPEDAWCWKGEKENR